MELTYSSTPKIAEENNTYSWISTIIFIIGILSTIVYLKAQINLKKINNKKDY